MSVPTYGQFIQPILRFLDSSLQAAHASGTGNRRSRPSPEQRLEVTASGQVFYKNCTDWAHDRLKRANTSSSPKRGYWK